MKVSDMSTEADNSQRSAGSMRLKEDVARRFKEYAQKR